uniref:Glycosyltransferase 2-like domain-containing protein n=1 Tax=Tetradesmus obliquus TaxID=3088 RepID=A0A383WC27_TETOB|eukprot:jgi/Sobl393_1/12988/SZX74256.1
MGSATADVVLQIASSGDGSTAAAGQTEQNDSALQRNHLESPSSSSMSRSSTSKSKQLTIYSANSIAQHYFGSQKQLDVLSRPSAVPSDDGAASAAEEEAQAPPRSFVKVKLYINAVVLAALISLTGLAYFNNMRAILRLKRWYALITIVLVPIGQIFSAYAINVAVSGIFALFIAGTSPLIKNTQTYSFLKTPIPRGAKLPQIIVQMPVYKESLEEVIQLSYFNVKRAMDYYTSKGGRVKFIVCDDGFQVVEAEEALARSKFYAANNITFVARPPANRRGTFKKASNLNYQLAISQLVAFLMKQQPGLTAKAALEAVWEQWGREFVAQGDLTMDDECLILLIDADTKVPEACMYDTVGEFLQCPEVAYTQHYTTPFTEQNRNYWEEYVSAFTKTIYFQGIAVSVAFGDNSPLVGHNAFLRWSALRAIAFTDETCRTGEVKVWGEDSVSEDFDLYIRLATVGSLGRYVMYTGDEFQEGVSLTYMDEVIKFKKFAYGACELLFNPIKQWPTKGPFNSKFLAYMRNKNIRWYQKTSLLAYLSSYLAMAAAFYACMLEGVLSVVDPGWHDYFMMRGFDVMLTCTVVFIGIGTFCNAIFYQWRRLGAEKQPNMFKITWDNLKWIPASVLFFNSVLFHMTEVCFIYFFGMKVSWGATAKEVQNKSWWQALKETIIAYKWEYLLYFVMLGGYSVCVWYYEIGLYRGWSVLGYCIGHILGPIVLNPTIMSLNW